MKTIVSFAICAIAAVIAVPPPAFACQVHNRLTRNTSAVVTVPPLAVACQIHDRLARNTAAATDKKCGNVSYVKMQISALTADNLTAGKEGAEACGLPNNGHRAAGTRAGSIFQADFF
jgi:hypothetical protein